MADKPTGLSCPLCLQADEPESMLTIHMTHGLAVREFDVTLCSQCVAAIVGAIESAASGAGLELADQGAAPDEVEANVEIADHPSISESENERRQ